MGETEKTLVWPKEPSHRRNAADETRTWPEEDYPKEEYPVWSILVLCYKNRARLNGMLDSVFLQDYPRIRLVVSDDGSGDFDPAEVRDYIDCGKRENIVERIVLKNDANLKTVRHVQKVLDYAGEYFVLTAADDRFVSRSAITEYNRTFKENPASLWIVARCNVLTPDYQRSIYLTPTPDDIPFFENSDPIRLYSRWCRRGMAIPCCMAFRKSALEAVGGIDDSYQYLEDWPLELKLCRSGYAPAYLPVVVAAHSTGGITNSNAAYGKDVRKAFFDDKARLFRQEVEPYLDLLTPEDLEAYRLYRAEIFDRNYFFDIDWEGSSRLQKLKLALRSPKHFRWVAEQQYMKRQDRFERKKMLLVSQLLFLVSYFFLTPGYEGLLGGVFRFLGYVDFAAAAVLIILAIVSFPLELSFRRLAEKRRRLVN